MAKSPASINLLVKKKSRSDVFLEWALSSGRFIIILTETIALAAFAYRFTLDRQIIDLHDKIKQKQAIIAYYKNDEQKYRDLQTKLANIKTLDQQAPRVPKLLDEIFTIATGKIIFQSLSVTPNSISIIGDTTSIKLMTSFINEVKKTPGVTGVSVTQVENHPDTGVINMTVEITVTDQKGTDGN